VDHDLGYRLYQSIERTKCALSNEGQTEFRFDEAAVIIDKSVTRSQFENWIDPEVLQINVPPKDVDAIFMTGGSSFVPAIRRLFEQKFCTEIPIRAGQEFTSVAEGLAIHALEVIGLNSRSVVSD
jgi:hypothetical chaperone protein